LAETHYNTPMIPVFTIVGRPNVGKSTLFNRLTKSRDALVADMPGVTRDRQYGDGVVGDRPYIVVDTGGIVISSESTLEHLTDQQVNQAIAEADRILFVVDAKDGFTPADAEIAKRLRAHHAKIVLLVNKADREEASIANADFYGMGFGDPHPISATQGRGVEALMHQLLSVFPKAELPAKDDDRVHVAIVGRPNVGKSTLINRMLGEERVITLDSPGTTRDSISIPFDRNDKKYMLIDTAGIRRRAKVSELIEKYSIIKSLQAIQLAHVVVVLIDSNEPITEQDLRLIGKVIEQGRSIILAFNKWDELTEEERLQVKRMVDRKLDFAQFARRYFISALHGTGVGNLFQAIDETHRAASQDIPTPVLTKALEQALKEHQPPLSKGRRIKLRYAHLGGHHPLEFVIHGKQTDDIPDSYKRFLVNYFRDNFKLIGVPLILKFKSDSNPFR
jgi:GTP-binding protein